MWLCYGIVIKQQPLEDTKILIAYTFQIFFENQLILFVDTRKSTPYDCLPYTPCFITQTDLDTKKHFKSTLLNQTLQG